MDVTNLVSSLLFCSPTDDVSLLTDNNMSVNQHDTSGKAKIDEKPSDLAILKRKRKTEELSENRKKRKR